MQQLGGHIGWKKAVLILLCSACMIHSAPYNMLHCEILKCYLSICKVHAKVLQNVVVCCAGALLIPDPHSSCTRILESTCNDPADCTPKQYKILQLYGAGLSNATMQEDSMLHALAASNAGQQRQRRHKEICGCSSQCVWLSAAGDRHSVSRELLSVEHAALMQHWRQDGDFEVIAAFTVR